MAHIASLLPLLAPLLLAGVSVSTLRARTHRATTLRAASLATGLSLAVALLTVIAVLVAGSRTSPLPWTLRPRPRRMTPRARTTTRR